MYECIDVMEDAKIFSTIDAKCSNWKIEIMEEGRNKQHLRLIMDYKSLSVCHLDLLMRQENFNEETKNGCHPFMC